MKISNLNFKMDPAFKNSRVISLLTASNNNSHLVLWKAKLGGEITTTPCRADDGTIYVARNEENTGKSASLFSIDSNGKIKWSFNVPDFIYSSPTVDKNGNIYFGCNDGHLYSLDFNGNLRWKQNLRDYIVCQPLITSDGKICAGSYDGKLYILDLNGNIKNNFKSDCHIDGEVKELKNGNIVFRSEQKLYVIDLDGNMKWKKDLGEIFDFSTFCDKIYTVDYNGNFQILNKDFEVQNSRKFPYTYEKDNAKYKISTSKTNIYLTDGVKYIYALDEQGGIKWKHFIGFNPFCSPAVGVDDSVAIVSDSGRVYYLNSNGNLKWKYKTGERIFASCKIFEEGLVYVPGRDGYLYALRERSLKEKMEESYNSTRHIEKPKIIINKDSVEIGKVKIFKNKKYNFYSTTL